MRFQMPALAMVAATVLLAPMQAHATDYRSGSLTVSDPWSRATPGGATVGAGYLRITNDGAAPDRLVGGSFAASKRFEIHTMKMEQGVMQMRALPQGLEIKPGATVELKPGAGHLMFPGLTQPLKAGERIKGTLQFEKAGPLQVEFAVEAMGAPPPSAGSKAEPMKDGAMGSMGGMSGGGKSGGGKTGGMAGH